MVSESDRDRAPRSGCGPGAGEYGKARATELGLHRDCHCSSWLAAARGRRRAAKLARQRPRRQ